MIRKFEFDKITEFEFYTDGMRGGITSRFIFRKNIKGQYFLEFRSSSDHSTRHGVILLNGTMYGIKSNSFDLGGEITLDVQKTEFSGKPVKIDGDDIVFEGVFAEKLRNKPQVDRRVKYW